MAVNANAWASAPLNPDGNPAALREASVARRLVHYGHDWATDRQNLLKSTARGVDLRKGDQEDP